MPHHSGSSQEKEPTPYLEQRRSDIRNYILLQKVRLPQDWLVIVVWDLTALLAG